MFFTPALDSLLAYLQREASNLADTPLPRGVQPTGGETIALQRGENQGVHWSVIQTTSYFQEYPFLTEWLLQFCDSPGYVPPPFLTVKVTFNTWADVLLQHPGFSYWMLDRDGCREIRSMENPRMQKPKTKAAWNIYGFADIEPYGGLPVIVLGDRTPREECAAQLCVHALRAARRPAGIDAPLYAFLRQYINRVAGVSADRENLVDEVVSRLIGPGYGKTRPPTPRSFTGYIRNLAADMRRREREPRMAARDFCRVDEAAARLGVCRRWIYRLIEKGVIRPEVRVKESALRGKTGVGIVTTRRDYLLTSHDLEQIRATAEDKERDRALVKLVARNRGLSENTARQWVRRRQRKGYGYKEIIEELRSAKWQSDKADG
jgi:excisionase family DNA binding protein